MKDMKRSTFSVWGVGGGLLVASVLLVGTFTRAADTTPESESLIRERLNKILYWSVSDELKLSPKQEKDMIATLESIQVRREKAFKDREAALGELRKLGKTPKDASVNPLLKRYQTAVEEIASLESEEYRQLMALLGANTLARFYIIRDDVAQKVREALKKSP